MVDRKVLAAKLAELEARIKRVRVRAPADAAALASDDDARELVAFNLMLAVQACVDIASHLVSDGGWRPAASLAEGFERLREHGVLTDRTARAIALATGLRNFVAHGYAGVDLGRLHAAAHGGLADLEAFAGEVAAWATGQA
jgi:uncharacterized protein YutE (UPF0331/DUF86 family)